MRLVWRNACEQGSHDQDDISELTLANGFDIWWTEAPGEGNHDRPEADMKDSAIQPEVYEGRYSGSIAYVSSSGHSFLVSNPIYVQRGYPLQAECYYMHVLEGPAGARLGLIDGNAPFGGHPGEIPVENDPSNDPLITWGEWLSSYGGHPDREWGKLVTPSIVSQMGYVRVVLQFNNDWARNGVAHYDAFQLFQEGDPSVPEPPQTGEVDYDRIEAIFRDAINNTQLLTT